jgi:beta-glucanase (GH16 family)
MLASDTGLVFIAKAHSNPFLAKRFAYAPQDSAVCIDSNVTNRDTFSYSSSALTSRKRYGYGYYEADIRIAKGQGLFPAFWLYYEGQEIEVMELTGSQSNQTQKYQVNVYGPIIKTSDIVGPFNNTDLSAAYHKYAIEWCNGRVAYFLDGNPVRMVSGKPGDYIPNMELEVIFNLAVDPWETIADPPPDKKMAVRSLKAYSFQYESGSVTTISNYDSFTYKVRDSYVLEDSPVNANNVYLRATDYIQLNAGFSVTSSYNNFNAITTNLSMPQQ